MVRLPEQGATSKYQISFTIVVPPPSLHSLGSEFGLLVARVVSKVVVPAESTVALVHSSLAGGVATGGPGTITVTCSPIVVPPANDECATATALSVGTTSFDTTNATTSAVVLPASCDEGVGTQLVKDVWYTLVAPCTGTLSVSTCGTATFNTKLVAYAATCPVTGSPVVACDDNTAGCSGSTSLITFSATQNALYYVRLGGATAGGTGTLTVTCTPSAPPCPADFNGDTKVDGADLAVLLGAWGSSGGDLDNNGVTDGADLAALLGAWGNCP